MVFLKMILPGNSLSDEVLAESVERIRAFKPRCLFGLTSALTSLAQFIQKKEIDISAYRPQLVITWAAPLLHHEERILSEVFQCPVSNIYGSREVGHVAMRCPMGSYHLNQESMIVELESRGGAGSNESAGEILVTPLDLSPMPFIRYRIGDIGEMRTGRCSCGRSLQLFSEVLGRSGELYQLKNGRMLSPNFWSHIFRADELVYAVERFQVVYKKEHQICIRVSPNDSFTPMSEAYLRQRLRKTLGPEIRVEVERVSVIHPLQSGKYQLVVNESDSEQNAD
jgi:phenylacetate-CoA ligase